LTDKDLRRFGCCRDHCWRSKVMCSHRGRRVLRGHGYKWWWLPLTDCVSGQGTLFLLIDGVKQQSWRLTSKDNSNKRGVN